MKVELHSMRGRGGEVYVEERASLISNIPNNISNPLMAFKVGLFSPQPAGVKKGMKGEAGGLLS